MDKKIVWTRLKHGQLNVYIAAIDEGLCYLGTPDEDFDDLEKWAKKRLPGYVLIEEEKAIQFYMTELIEYLDGKLKNSQRLLVYTEHLFSNLFGGHW